MDATPDELKALFAAPPPDAPASVVPPPARHAGWTHASTEALLANLRDNHQRWHIFFNEKQFHNHATHHLLAIYAMGADKTLLDAAYETHVVYQKPAFPPPEEGAVKKVHDKVVIDETNWKEYLGDERYYQAYVNFFSRILLAKPNSIPSFLEDYVMSKDANVVPGKNGKKPLMLSRFMAGFLHPLIHSGYGTEFSMPGMISEGVAEAAAQPYEAESFFPPELFDTAASTAGLVSRLSSLVVSAPAAAADVHALTILARIAKDAAFAPAHIGLPIPEGEHENSVDRVVRVGGAKLSEYASEWMKTVTPDRDVLRRKFEELVWMNTVVYGVGGWAARAQSADDKKQFNGDFFYMHLVTSALMTTTLINTLSLQSASLLLRVYFLFSLVVYIARGRPALPIGAFYAHTTPTPSPPDAKSVQPAPDTLPPAGAPNPWLPILQTTLVHPNEHLCKAQRALAHFATVYGGAAPGAFAAVDAHAGESADGAGLEGAAALDGTLFVRVAGLTADRLGWMREGEEKRIWDMVGFFDKSAEEKRAKASVERMPYDA